MASETRPASKRDRPKARAGSGGPAKGTPPSPPVSWEERPHLAAGEKIDPRGPGAGAGNPWAFSGFEIDLDSYVEGFAEQVLAPYEEGKGTGLPADVGIARSLVPPGTGKFRDFSHISPELPVFLPDNCVACMECVTLCPDTAILAKVAERSEVEAVAEAIAQIEDQEGEAAEFSEQWVETTKFYGLFERKGEAGGLFAIYVDATKCKGCGECVEVCGDHGALKMEPKTDLLVAFHQDRMDQMRSIPETPPRFLAKGLAVDTMLKEERTQLFVGGAGSCAGCGEATAIRMMLAVTGNEFPKEDIGIVAATGCNTVFGSTYPYNPYRVTWSNSLFENAPAVAMGIRERWNQTGWEAKRLWVLGGDGAMYDIGFQSLSRMLASGMDIKVLVLDTQVYSNTGGQASTSTFPGQAAKMAPYGKLRKGKIERRKEIGQIALMHPEVYVAQTATPFINHFCQAIRDANSFPGPALVNVYTTCQPEHGVADDRSTLQARLAVNSRAFPLFVFDPRRGTTLKERLSLKGNPSMTEDWMKASPSGEPYTFADFARSEGRFANHFDEEGTAGEALLAAQQERLGNWRLLQDLARVKPV